MTGPSTSIEAKRSSGVSALSGQSHTCTRGRTQAAPFHTGSPRVQ
jgi:hypothetical protein